MPRERFLDIQSSLYYDPETKTFNIVGADDMVYPSQLMSDTIQTLKAEFRLDYNEAIAAITEAFGNGGHPVLIDKKRLNDFIDQ